MAQDLIVIGAGAAGLMTAITAAKAGVRVLMLDGQKKIGAKILMSGGTRCNVTNKTVTEKDYQSQSIMRVRNIIRGFDNAQAIKFFKDLGIELILESTNKYFPTTHSGKTVLDALINECVKRGVKIIVEQKVTALTYAKDEFTVKGEGFKYQAKAVVLTTGGLSYPTTGSDGVGYRLAQSFGHDMVPTFAALTPFTTNDVYFKKLSGIALPATLTLYAANKKQIAMTDDFLFTHFGFSGPVALDMSRHWVALKNDAAKLFVNFMPPHSVESFNELIMKETSKHPSKTIKSMLAGVLPARLIETLLFKIKLNENTALNQLKKTDRMNLVNACIHYPLEIAGVVGYSKAEVTAGGIDLAQVNPKTLESNLQPGLFFAGEILDVDGRIGGFNFQWAWASGFCAGNGAAVFLRKEK